MRARTQTVLRYAVVSHVAYTRVMPKEIEARGIRCAYSQLANELLSLDY